MQSVARFLGLENQWVKQNSLDRSVVALQCVYGGAYIVVGLYGTALLYKVGVISALLGSSLSKKLEARVNEVKRKTEPATATVNFVKARNHLLSVYGHTGACWFISALGTIAFFKFPHVPLAVPLATTVITTGGLFGVSKKNVLALGRYAMAGALCFGLGYSFGPINWVGYDTVIPFATVIGSTFAGFSVSLYITRGTLSYFMSSQVLSFSLAVAGCGLSSQKGRPSPDVNAMLSIQIFANLVLGLCHTVPTVYRYTIKPTHTTTDVTTTTIEEDEDPLKEAVTIYGAICYFSWYVFRKVCLSILKRVSNDDTHGFTREEKSKIRQFTAFQTRLERTSEVMASISFLLVYIKVVGMMQRKNSTTHFDSIRSIFATLSPLNWFLRA